MRFRRLSYKKLLAEEMSRLPPLPSPDEEEALLLSQFEQVRKLPMADVLRSNVAAEVVPDTPGLFLLFRGTECVYASDVRSLRKRVWCDFESGEMPLRSRSVTRGIALHLDLADADDLKRDFALLDAESMHEIREWLSGCEAAWFEYAKTNSKTMDQVLIHRYFHPILQPALQTHQSRAEIARESKIRLIERDCARRIEAEETRVSAKRSNGRQHVRFVLEGLVRVVSGLIVLIAVLIFIALSLDGAFTTDNTNDYDQQSENGAQADDPSQAVQDYCAGAVSAAQEEGCLSNVTDEDLP